jgi:CBS-domain-containing membrane protein
MNAADIMTRKVVTARPDTSVSQVARLLLDNKISALPVIDDQDRVVGIVSEGDLLGAPPARSLRGVGGCVSLMTKQSAWRRSRPPGICRFRIL